MLTYRKYIIKPFTATSKFFRQANQLAILIGVGWLILAGFLYLYSFLGSSTQNIEPILPKLLSIILAVCLIVNGLTTVRSLSNKSPLLTTMSQVIIACAMVGYQISTTNHFESLYVFAWVLPILIAALSSVILLGLVWIVTTAYFVLNLLGIVGAQFSNTRSIVAFAILQMFFFAATGLYQLMNSEKYSQTPGAVPQTKGKSKAKSSDELSTYFNNLNEGLIAINASSQLVYINDSVARITGWSKADASGLDYHSVLKFIDEDKKPLQVEADPFVRILTKGTPYSEATLLMQRKDLTNVATRISATPIVNEENTVIGVSAIIKDITEEKAQESERAEFISTASHEMRTPVAAIEGYLQLAMTPKIAKVDKAGMQYLKKALNSTHQLGNLLKDLLTAAKSEDGQLVNHPEVLEIGKLMNELVPSLAFEAKKKNLRVTMNSGAGNLRPSFYAYVDPARIREVVSNIFLNAVKYTKEGSVNVSYSGNKDFIVLSIADTGSGIPKTEIPHLFQKFYRVDNSDTRLIGGSGLGLFIVRKIVEMYGGRVWVESVVGKGSTFFVAIPRLSSDDVLKLQSGTAVMPQTASELSDTGTKAAEPEVLHQAAETAGDTNTVASESPANLAVPETTGSTSAPTVAETTAEEPTPTS